MARDAEVRDGGFEAVEVSLHDRLHVGVEDGGVGAFVLAPLAGDLVARRHRDARQVFAQIGGARRLVLGRGVGVEELDRHRLHLLAAAFLDHRAEVLHRHGLELAAVGVNTFAHLEAPPPRHERRRLLETQVVHVRPVAARDLQYVAEARGRHERGLDPLALGDGVDHRGAAMHEERDLGGRNPGKADGVDHPLGEIARGA